MFATGELAAFCGEGNVRRWEKKKIILKQQQGYRGQ